MSNGASDRAPTSCLTTEERITAILVRHRLAGWEGDGLELLRGILNDHPHAIPLWEELWEDTKG